MLCPRDLGVQNRPLLLTTRPPGGRTWRGLRAIRRTTTSTTTTTNNNNNNTNTNTDTDTNTSTSTTEGGKSSIHGWQISWRYTFTGRHRLNGYYGTMMYIIMMLMIIMINDYGYVSWLLLLVVVVVVVACLLLIIISMILNVGTG